MPKPCCGAQDGASHGQSVGVSRYRHFEQRSSPPITGLSESMTDTNEQPSSPSPSVKTPNNTTTGTNDNLPTTNAPHSSTTETAQTSKTRPAAESPNTTTEVTLQDVLDTMHNSDFFPRVAKDPQSRFWSAYERIATQHDNEFLEMHNGQMDVLLIFAGLFSAISSAFIVSMSSSLNPNPSDTTNALLMILINKVDNDTFPTQQAALPVWTGPSSTTVWIQTLAYMSLSSSLLAAFGAVLEKQWLGHFKTSRFGKGALIERCKRRQQKFDGLEAWHFSAVIATLPILLQLSLLFFGIALAADIWTQQHTVASVVIATTSLGVIFYFFTLLASLKSPDCPFQTPVSTMAQHVLSVMATFGKAVREKWTERPKSWAGFWFDLQYFSGRALSRARNLIIKPITPFVVYLSQHLRALRQHVRPVIHAEAGHYLEQSRAAGSVRSGSVPDGSGDLEMPVLEACGGVQTGPSAGEEQSLNLDLEQAGGSEHSGYTSDVHPDPSARGEQTMWHRLEELNLAFLKPHIEAQRAEDSASSNAVQWTLETTTDMDIIVTAASMIPEIEWPDEDDVTNVLERLQGHFYACFHTGQILVLAQVRAVVCLKAIYHIYIKRLLPFPFHITEDGRIQPKDRDGLYYMRPNQEFLVILCAIGDPIELDIASLPTPDCMWMAHMFAYRLNGDGDDPKFVTFVINFIHTCIVSESPRLVADCLLLAGQLVGMRVDPSHLARLDKSKGIGILEESVISCVLGVLLGEIPGRIWQPRALKLLPSILQHFVKGRIHFSERRTNERCIKYCFRLLEEASGTEAEDKVRSRTVASLVHHFRCLMDWKPRNWCTQREFDLLVDYHLRICQDMDYDTIPYSFDTLSALCGSPSTQGRMRRYIDTMIQFMSRKRSHVYPSLRAAFQVRKDVALIGRDDATVRKDFSMELAVVLTDATQPVPHDMNPFRKITFLDYWRDIPYLFLLSTLSQDVTWQPHLRQSGHFDNCVVIADTMSYNRHEHWSTYVVPIAHIFANIDASGVHTPIWPLILRAWKYIFNLEFFGGGGDEALFQVLSRKDFLEALPIITAFARRLGDDKEDTLITLVEQACNKLDEEKQFRQQGEVQDIQEQTSVGSPDICELAKQIREFLDFEVSL